MKRIVIFCDGTWNRSDSDTPTNVVRCAQAMSGVDSAGCVQVPIYIQGVGTGRGPTRVSRRFDAWLGGGLGWGLMANIEEAYRHIVFLYAPGDEIYIFGFSRGAYTARSLAGLLRSTGIVERNALHRVPDALARYRALGNPSTHPSTEQSHAFRADISPTIATSQAELAWRKARGLDTPHLLQIAYLGVWDSVGALGMPRHVPLLGRWAARRYRFHDANLSSMVRAARHAVALDEQRRTFLPTRWDNVADLNAARQALPGADPASPPPYQELFFPGDHGSVGGGGDITDLSSIALRWIIEGAQAVGLGFQAAALQAIATEENPMGPLRNTSVPPSGLLNRLMRRNPVNREGPNHLEALHPATLTRWTSETKSTSAAPYRPGSLAHLEPQLAQLQEQTLYSAEGPTRHA